MAQLAATQLQELQNAAETAYQTYRDKATNMLQQVQTDLRDAQTKLQELRQKQQQFTTDLDQTFKSMELEASKRAGFFAAISGKKPDDLTQKEMMAQKRTTLLQSFKQLNNLGAQVEQQVQTATDNTLLALQQLQHEEGAVRTSLQDLSVTFERLAQNPAQQAVPADGPLVASENGLSLTRPQEVLSSLAQVEAALIALQQGVTGSRIWHELRHSIADLGAGQVPGPQ